MLATQPLIETRARELDILSQAVIATDVAGEIVYWNAAAERLYGWSSEEAVGRQITDVTPTQQSREQALRIMETLRRGEHWSGEFEVQRKDGLTFLAHVVDAPVLDDSGTLVGIIGVSSDLSPLARLQRLARELSAATTRKKVADLALRATMDAVGASAGWFMTLSSDGQCMEALHSLGYDPVVVERFRTIPIDAPVPIAIAMRSGEPIYVSSRDEWNTRFPAVADLADPNTRAWIALPLLLGNERIGALGLSVRTPRDFTARDRDLLATMAQHAAVAVDRARLFDAEHTAREEAEAARAKAEEANRSKSAFLASMSHELRTPLGAILGYQDLLSGEILGPLNQAQQDHLKRLRSNATHLLALIDQLLSYARLEAVRESIHAEQRPVGQLVEEVNDIVTPLTSAKHLDYRASVEDAGAVVQTDVQKLKQILVNLVGNAIKYTDNGSIALDVEIRAGQLRAAVSDTGIGIAPEHIDRVFEPFWQVDRGHRGTSGTGLGLSVSRSLARLLGGDITVASTLGKGSRFTLSVPAGLSRSAE